MLGACGAFVCACGVVWAPFLSGLSCFFMKTLQKVPEIRKWELRTRVPVLRTRVPNFGHIYRHAIETPEGGRLDLISPRNSPYKLRGGYFGDLKNRLYRLWHHISLLAEWRCVFFITSIEALFYSIPITYLKLRKNHSSSKVMARTNACVKSLVRVSWQ